MRHGGISSSPYNGLNVSISVGDSIENVEFNLKLIQKTLNLSSLVRCNQLHGSEVCLVEEISNKKFFCDALITSRKDIGLLIQHADCQAALFYDPLKNAIGAAHAGWRGSCLKIYTKTIDSMKAAFGTRPENLLVAISPSLSKEHAEFCHYKKEFPEPFWKYQSKPLHFDFWKISFDELVQSGVKPENIQLPSLCTYANPEDFFSYRREKITGRLGTVIGLK